MIKYIKLGLFGIIGLIGLINFSYGANDWVVRDNGVYGYSTIDNSLDINVVNKGQLMTERFGQTKRMLALASSDDKKVYFFWSNNQRPYILVNTNGHFYQGFLSHYYLCPYVFTGLNAYFDGCTEHTITDNFSVEVGALFDSITINDQWGYRFKYSSEGCNYGYSIINSYCFSSSQYDKSICFKGGSAGSSISACQEYKDTYVNSLGFSSGTDFTFINDLYLNTPPGFTPAGSGGNIDGSSNEGQNVALTGNVMYHKCTNGYVISQVGNLYGGSSICYAGTNDTGLIINGGITWVPVDKGLTFKEVYQNTSDGTYGYFSSYANWRNSWNDTMYRFKMGTVDYHVWEGMPIYLYTYFARLYDNGLVYQGQQEVYNVLNYCKLVLYSDYESEYKGSYFSSYCDSFSYSSDVGGSNVTTGEVGSVTNDNDLEVLPPNYNVGGGSNGGSNTSNGTIVSVDWSGTLSGDTNKNFEGKTFINDFYQKLQRNYQKPINSATGIIPTYIYVFMIALILFRFLQH